jgi:ferredoxin
MTGIHLCLLIVLTQYLFSVGFFLPRALMSRRGVYSSKLDDVPMFGEEWARIRGMEPGHGGIWPGDPNAPTFKVTIKNSNGTFEHTLDVPVDRYIHFYFEEMGIDVPIVNKPRMCRQGCCTICTVKILEGEVKMDAPLGLLKDLRKEGYALSCAAYPRSDLILQLQSEDEAYIRQWSEGFKNGSVEWGGVFMDEDD